MTRNTFPLIIILLTLTSFNLNHLHDNDLTEGTIVNLYDAFGKDASLTKDWGFSCIIKYNGKTILFDAGSNADIFKANVNKLRIDLTKVDIVVVSHAHFDHLNGIDYLLTKNPKVKIFLPNDMYAGVPITPDMTGAEPLVTDSLPKYHQYFDGGPTKFAINQSGRFWNANTEYVKNSQEILPGIKLVATSSSNLGYFNCYPRSNAPNENECRQTGLPELSLSLKTSKGEVLIVGCSHSGVENIVSETMKVVSTNIDMVYGGFHTVPFDRKKTIEVVDKLKNEYHVHRVAPAHCTGHLAFKILQDKFGDNYLFAGLGATVKY
jgi:7,8-dihydropterin-6-yl-methyl-4-(beta-D-ribofuranosyl)aminobenzene 5'-phosphate synthase